MSMSSEIMALAGSIRDKINTIIPRLLPTGGTTGQILSKVNGSNFNTHWITPAGGSGGSINGNTTDVDISTPQSCQTFTIIDPLAITSQKVIAVVSGRSPSGGYVDQVELNPVIVQANIIVDGQVNIILSSSTGYPVMGKYAIDYVLA